MENSYRNRKRPINFEKIDQIRKQGKYAGFIGVAKATKTGETCTLGRICFLSAGKNNPGSDERFDSIIRSSDCTGRWTFDEMKTWLQGVKILPKG